MLHVRQTYHIKHFVIIALTFLHRIQHTQGCHIDDTADRSGWSEDVHRLCSTEHHRTYCNTIARCGLEQIIGNVGGFYVWQNQQVSAAFQL